MEKRPPTKPQSAKDARRLRLELGAAIRSLDWTLSAYRARASVVPERIAPSR
jgi:hypothetical protein